MKVQILSWNVRGVNDHKKRKVIKAFIKTQRVDLVCLQETELKGTSSERVRSLGVGRSIKWAGVDAIGAPRGILNMWNYRVLQLLEKEDSQYMLSSQFRNREDNNTWIFTSAYGPTIGEERVQFWEELGAIRGRWQGSWCIGGDFDALRFLDERYREGRLTSVTRKFSQIIDELELKDISLRGEQHTWKGGLNNNQIGKVG